MSAIRIQDGGWNQTWTWIGSMDGIGEGKMGFGKNCVVKSNEEWEMRGIVWNQQVFSANSILS
jgi:hypothetical protein